MLHILSPRARTEVAELHLFLSLAKIPPLLHPPPASHIVFQITGSDGLRPLAFLTFCVPGTSVQSGEAYGPLKIMTTCIKYIVLKGKPVILMFCYQNLRGNKLVIWYYICFFINIK